MSAKILDRLISAFVGAVSAVGTVWFLNANGPDAQSPPTAAENAPVKFDRLEVDALRVNEVLLVADPQTQEPTIELRDGSISAQKSVLTEQIGAYRVLGQKLQTTPNDPLNAQSPVFAELATNQDGGAYLLLLSPQGTHSVSMEFDKTEKGCLISQNNEDSSMIAQAIFVKPTAADAAPAAGANVAPLDQSFEALRPENQPNSNAESFAPVDAGVPLPSQDVAPVDAGVPLPAQDVAPVDAGLPLPAQDVAPVDAGLPLPAQDVAPVDAGVPLPAQDVAPVDAGLPLPSQDVAPAAPFPGGF